MPLSKYMLLAMLTGCASTLSLEPPPADWPELLIIRSVAPLSDFPADCVNASRLLEVKACTVVDFDKKRCDIIFRDDRPIKQWVEDQEEGHCKGKDHPGEDIFRRAWEKWKTR